MSKKRYVTLRGIKVEVTDLISSPPDRTTPEEEQKTEKDMTYNPFDTELFDKHFKPKP